MLHSLLSLKLAAMAAALGLDTAEWKNPSPAVVEQVTALENLQKAAADPGSQPAGPTLQEIVNKIKTLADGGDKDAQFAMGLFLQQSNQQGALQQALQYYEKAAANDQLQAMNNYGFIIAASTQDKAEAAKGIAKIKEAAGKGLNAARRNMATISLRGMGGEPQDIAGAKGLLEQAAAAGDNQAEFELAQFYLGAGGKDNLDDAKAWDYLTKASDHGNPNALAALGSVLFDGKEFGSAKEKKPKNPKLAVEKFKKLADQKNPAGLRTMGELYQKGIPDTGIQKNFATALDFYKQAARANDAVAQVILAGFYDRGYDDNNDGTAEVNADPAGALELYRLAAQNNVPLANYNIGIFYEAGRAVDRDMTKAFGYFLQSAVNGFGPGMQKAGVYYLNGAGTLKDPVAATGWFQRSAGAGVAEGLVSLGVMAENGLVPNADPNATQFQTAAAAYVAVEKNPSASDAVRMEALMRLGALYFRGLMVAPPKTSPEPDMERAYIYFRMASEIDPKNKEVAAAKEQAEKPLTTVQKEKAGKVIDDMKKAHTEVMAAAGATAAPTTTPPTSTPTSTAPPTGTSPKGKGKVK